MMFKLTLIVIKLRYSSRYLFYTLIECEKDISEDEELLELRFLRGIIRTDLSSVSSICMTYAPFSYLPTPTPHTRLS